jgi:alpha-L-rhamnosidase
LDNELIGTLTNTRIPGWAHIVAAGGTFTWETWVPSDDIGDSMSHGWGSCALVAMQEVLLGVTPLAPPTRDGTTVLDIQPPPGKLSVSGQVPTISGTAEVRWERSGSATELELLLPPNTSGRVQMPAGRLTEGGRPLSESGLKQGGVPGRTTVLVPSGHYSFRSTQA